MAINAELGAFVFGLALGVVSNILPSLPETRSILSGGDIQKIESVHLAWAIVVALAGVALGFMLAARGR